MNNPILITGVTGAVGIATAKELAKNGKHDLILVGRNESKLQNIKKELNAIKSAITIEIVMADLSSVASVRKAVETIKLKTNTLSGILNIAGMYSGTKNKTADGYETMWATNHLGPFQLTMGLLDLLKGNSTRVVTVSAPSTTKLDFDDLQGENKFSALNKFGASKMANLLFAFALARKFEGTTDESIAFHPGLVKSNITNEMPAMLKAIIRLFSSSADKPGKTLVKILSDPKYANANGKFFDRNEKELKRPGYSGDQTIQEKLWNVSLEMIR